MSAAAAKVSATRLIERLDLLAWSTKTLDKLSKGMSQKVQLATALVNSPRLLILDEPFSGLEPLNQQVLEDLILEMANAGSTVIFSTHVMQHAERLCDRLLLLSRGKMVFQGTQEQARATAVGRLTLTCQADPTVLTGVANARRVSPEGAWSDWDVTLAAGVAAADLLFACTSNGFLLRRFESRQPSLHDVFLQLVGAETERPK